MYQEWTVGANGGGEHEATAQIDVEVDGRLDLGLRPLVLPYLLAEVLVAVVEPGEEHTLAYAVHLYIFTLMTLKYINM